MKKMISWFGRRKICAAIVAGAYLIPNILCHDLAQGVTLNIQNKISLRVLNSLITAAALIVLLALLTIFGASARKATLSAAKLLCWSFALVLVLLSYNTLMEYNVESVHFLQYGLLAIPVFALTKRMGETVVWVTLLGAVDEGYQFLVLHRTASLYDFNDVVLNLVGAAIGVALIITLVDPDPMEQQRYSVREMMRSSAIPTITGVLIGGISLYWTGFLRVFPGQKAIIVINRRVVPIGYWKMRQAPHKSFYVLSPGQGLFLCVGLMAVYVLLDYWPVLQEKAGSSRLAVIPARDDMNSAGPMFGD